MGVSVQSHIKWRLSGENESGIPLHPIEQEVLMLQTVAGLVSEKVLRGIKERAHLAWQSIPRDNPEHLTQERKNAVMAALSKIPCHYYH